MMERYVIVIPADEEQKARLVRCDDGDTCKLETLQELVGGCIETAESCLASNWAREDELIGFAKPVCETICAEWGIRLGGEGDD